MRIAPKLGMTILMILLCWAGASLMFCLALAAMAAGATPTPQAPEKAVEQFRLPQAPSSQEAAAPIVLAC
jgi:hypothetical protein